MTIQPSASPRASAAQAGLLVEQRSSKLEYITNRDMLAALEANPRAARRLARNRMLVVLVPLIIVLAFIALMLLT
jgi:hypothetical protein